MKKIIGSILMILGTCIGAGMLALPVVTAHNTFSMSMLMLVCSWLFMTIGAFSLLEVNLALPEGNNLISMAQATLGKAGKVVTWIVYLLLLYSLLCAYLSGASDIVQALLGMIDIHVARSVATIIALVVCVLIVYQGIGSVDVVNRGLMSVKLLTLIILAVAIAPHIHMHLLTQGDYWWRNSAFMVMMTSFGYAIILPSIRRYLKSDVKALKKVVLLGSLVPLVLYIVFLLVVQGLVVRTGHHGLIAMITSNNTNSSLMQGISYFMHSEWLSSVVRLFISICALTSFLGVSMCLTHFIADGIKAKEKGKDAARVYALSFLPPLVLVLFLPGVFIAALGYAGMLCIVLLIILPLVMLYSARHHKDISQLRVIPLHKVIILVLVAIALILLAWQT